MSLTPWSRVLLENLIVTLLVKKFPAFFGTQRFIAMFIGLYPRRDASIPLGPPCGLFPAGFPIKILNAFLIVPMRVACPAHLKL